MQRLPKCYYLSLSYTIFSKLDSLLSTSAVLELSSLVLASNSNLAFIFLKSCFKEINTLESLRYKVTGINVKEELFNSEDFNITYNFEAKSIENVYDLSDLSTEDIINAEKLIYGEKGYVLNTVLDQYFTNKDKKKKEDGDNNE